MALIKCPECGKYVSTTAPTCPGCGCQIKTVMGEDRYEAVINKANNMVQCKKCGAWNPVGSSYCKSCNKMITGEDYTYTNQKAEGISPVESNTTKATKIPFYQSTWFTILMLCCCCFPIGLFLMWKYKKFNKPVRIIITALFTIMFIASIANSGTSSDASSNESTIAEAQSAQESESMKNEVPETSVQEETAEESTDVEAEETETVEPTLSEEDFKASCQEIGYKKLLRNPEDYIGQHIVITAKVQQVMQGGFLDNGQYYRIMTDNDGYETYFDDEYFMYDCRPEDSMKLLQDDVLKIYAEFTGMEEVKRALTGVTEEVPAINAYYVELISE